MAIRVEMLVTFMVVARKLHFTRAAERLHLSQSGVSRRLAALERCLGTAVVRRSTRRVALTPEGKVLLPHVISIVRDLRLTSTALDRARAHRRKSL